MAKKHRGKLELDWVDKGDIGGCIKGWGVKLVILMVKLSNVER